jgi:hypothetical protein
MKLLAIITYLVAYAIAFILAIYLYRAFKEIKQLREDRNDLIKEKAKVSDQVRFKGIEVDQLETELQRYKSLPIVALTSSEKKIILNALEFPKYKAKVQDPKTKRFIRIIYNTLRDKIKESIKEGI